MNPHLASFLTAFAGFGLGFLVALFCMWPEKKRVEAEAAKPDPKYFTEAEQDLWLSYELKIERARDEYNAEMAALRDRYDPDRMERAKVRFTQRLREEREARAKIELLKVR